MSTERETKPEENVNLPTNALTWQWHGVGRKFYWWYCRDASGGEHARLGLSRDITQLFLAEVARRRRTQLPLYKRYGAPLLQKLLGIGVIGRWFFTEIAQLEGVGHCPQDEAPELVNPLVLDWVFTVSAIADLKIVNC